MEKRRQVVLRHAGDLWYKPTFERLYNDPNTDEGRKEISWLWRLVLRRVWRNTWKTKTAESTGYQYAFEYFDRRWVRKHLISRESNQ